MQRLLSSCCKKSFQNHNASPIQAFWVQNRFDCVCDIFPQKGSLGNGLATIRVLLANFTCYQLVTERVMPIYTNCESILIVLR